VSPGANFDITPDGKRFVVVLPQANTSSSEPGRPGAQINVALNWLEELKRRVPVK
jgi:hypothetical protein